MHRGSLSIDRGINAIYRFIRFFLLYCNFLPTGSREEPYFLLISSCRAEAASAALGVAEFVNLDDVGSEHGSYDHLSHALIRFDHIGLVGDVAQSRANLAAVVAVDNAYAVRKADPVLHAESASRVEKRRAAVVGKLDRDAGGYDRELSGCEGDRLVDTGVKIHSRGA